MEIEKYMRGRVTVISLRGELDSASSEDARQRVGELVPDDGAVLLDLGRMTYMSSAGLRLLLLVYQQVRAAGVSFALARVPTELREVMSATGFLDFFTVTSTVDDGVEALVT